MTYKILLGNNLDVLPTLLDNSVDSIVTDPPYELGFMGKKWDSSGIAYSVELWKQCLRVLKPGGHLLAFSGSRTYHRMVVAIEDAGFEIRDMISWISNKTFPKSHNIQKATGESKWQGWGTALKPTVEPIVMARKPVEGTIANNVLKWGTGGLNIDGSRIGIEERTNEGMSSLGVMHDDNWEPKQVSNTVQGRWPANIILDPYTAELLDEQSGTSKPSKGKTGKVGGQQGLYENGHSPDYVGTWPTDNGGGASRFFYVAKASKRDRNEGLDELPDHDWSKDGAAIPQRAERPFIPSKNHHPTVKPTTLMEYLIKLVTPPGGVVLDPFTGSGSTGKAAILQGFDFIGIEMTEEYLPIIEGRLKHAEQLVAEAKEQDKAKESQVLF